MLDVVIIIIIAVIVIVIIVAATLVIYIVCRTMHTRITILIYDITNTKISILLFYSLYPIYLSHI